MKKILSLAISVALCSNFLIPALASFEPSTYSESNQTSSQVETIFVNSLSYTSRTENFDENWRFNYGDVQNAQSINFNDSDWSNINLPHDYSADLPYSTSGEGESGYKEGGVGWYRKSFTLTDDYKNKTISIDFGGVYMNATVYLNGEKLGTHPYGYTSFSFELPYELLNFDSENVISVRVDNPVPTSRWYSGSGIYRSVELTVTDNVHISRHGVTTETTGVETGTSTLNYEVIVSNDSSEPATVSLDATIEDSLGEALNTVSSAAVTIEPNSSSVVSGSMVVSNPDLWSVDSPNLYTLVTDINQDGIKVDSLDTSFGFRYYEFDRDTGFTLNGVPMKLEGVCMHHDQGSLGAEAWYRSMERQVEILKDMGVNSIRVTHNPASKELVEICDRLGMLLIDESFDTWIMIKNSNVNDYSQWFEEPIEAGNTIVNGVPLEMTWAEYDTKEMAHQDKNAPSVIAYSLGNEIFEGTGYSQAHRYADIAQQLIDWVNEVDDTRLITFGQNDNSATSYGYEVSDVIHAAGGIIGRNYGSPSEMEQYYNKGYTIYASETSSSVNSRGVYDNKQNAAQTADKRLTSYDKSAVGWGAMSSESWWNTIRFDYIAGEYLWTGFDYLGEPTPWNGVGSGSVGSWPAPKSSYFGIIDTAGLPKDSFYLYQSQWNEHVNTIHVLPTWDRNDVIIDDNGNVEVVVYSDADIVKVFLNDIEIGSATATTHTTDAGFTYKTFDTGTGYFYYESGHKSLYSTFYVPYEEGTLTVKGYTADGTEITDFDGRNSVSTTTGASTLSVSADHSTIDADGRDLSYITIDVLDDNGNIVNGAEPEITVEVSGNGRLLALDNGRQDDHTPYTDDSREAMAGKLVAIVQSTKEDGSFTVTATANGLSNDSVTITTKASSESATKKIVSYDIARNYYVKANTTPVLPTDVLVTYSDKTNEELAVSWNDYDDSLLSSSNTFVITGSITSLGIPISVNITTIEGIPNIQNYSTSIAVNGSLILPSTMPLVEDDGTITNIFFPVNWDTNGFSSANTGIYEISGTANVFGTDSEISASVRVTEGEIIAGSNISSSADGLFLNSVGNTVADIENLRDNDNSTVFSTNGDILFRYATAQNINTVEVILENANPDSAITVSWSGDGINYQSIPKISGETTFDANGLVPAVWIKVSVPEITSISEIKLNIGSPSFEKYDSATLESLNINGLSVDAVSLANNEYPTQALIVNSYDYVPFENASVTPLPTVENEKRFLIVSEDHSNINIFTVLLGQGKDGNGSSAEDASLDYDYTKTIATAGSSQPLSGSEGPASLIIDDNPATFWHSEWAADLSNRPEDRWVMLELEEESTLSALRYLPRPSAAENGTITAYEVYVSTDGENFEKVSEGNWPATSGYKLAEFDSAVNAKFVKLVAITSQSPGHASSKFVSGAELRLRLASDSEKTDISSFNLNLDVTEYAYTGDEITPIPTVTDENNNELTYGVDFIVEYENNTNPGDATGKIIGITSFTGEIPFNFTIQDDNLTLNDITDLELSTFIGVHPNLPDFVSATTSLDTQINVNVTWEPVSEESYKNVGEFSVNGTIDGYVNTVTANVTVVGVKSVEYINVLTAKGSTPSLPENIFITLTTNEVIDKPVTWDTQDIDFNVDIGTNIPVSGVATLENDVLFNVNAVVTIIDSLDSSQNLSLGTSNEYPKALSSHSTTDDPATIIDGLKNFGQPKAIWSDWVRNEFHEAPFVAVVLGETEITDTTANTISIGFFDENSSQPIDSGSSVRIPKDYKVEYYTGESYEVSSDPLNVASWTDHPFNNDDNWTEVTYIGAKPAVPQSADFAQMVVIPFETVTSSAFRVVLTPYPNQWVGVEEFELYNQIPVVVPTTITSITNPDTIDVLVGDFATLPTTVTATLSDNTTTEFDVVWDVSSLDTSAVNTIDITGIITLKDDFSNIFGLTATVTVNVYEPAEDIYVTFVYDDGVTANLDVLVDDLGKITFPENPIRTDYRFEGWFYDLDGLNEATSDDVFDENTFIYAYWTYITPEPEVTTPVRPRPTPEPDPEPEPEPEVEITDPDVPLSGDTDEETTKPKEFTDINSHWAKEDIDFVVSSEIFTGISDDTFAPEDTMTRAMFVTVLHRLAGNPETTEALVFTDVPKDIYYADAVIWAYSNGYISGTSEDTFSPDMNISREDLVTILWRYVGKPTTEGTLDFEDADKVSNYAIDALKYAFNIGIISGKSETILAPKDSATRAEVATIIARFMRTI